jgi:hypothetical protein
VIKSSKFDVPSARSCGLCDELMLGFIQDVIRFLLDLSEGNVETDTLR